MVEVSAHRWDSESGHLRPLSDVLQWPVFIERDAEILHSTLAQQNRDTSVCTPFTMALYSIDEDNSVDTFRPTNKETRPTLGHRTIHGVVRNDSESIFSHSTNSTASNLIGTGRVLGNLYGAAGLRLERTLGDFAHRAGFGPEAIYAKICTICQEDWDWRENDQKCEAAIFILVILHSLILHWHVPNSLLNTEPLFQAARAR